LIADGLAASASFSTTIYHLIRDNDTRWNSLFAMIARALELRDSIERFILNERNKWTTYEVTTSLPALTYLTN
jgi:hypothetical protein